MKLISSNVGGLRGNGYRDITTAEAAPANLTMSSSEKSCKSPF